LASTTTGGKSARVVRVPPLLMRSLEGLTSFFEASLNVADRLAFAELVSAGTAFDADMGPSYEAFGLDPSETTRLEDYLREYYDTILRKLREMESDLDKESKKKLPF